MCHINKVRANVETLPQHFGGVDVKIDTRQQRSKTLDQVKLKKKTERAGNSQDRCGYEKIIAEEEAIDVEIDKRPESAPPSRF